MKFCWFIGAGLLVILFACQNQDSPAACNGRTLVLPIAAGGSYINLSAADLAKPGDTLQIPAGTYDEIVLGGLEGSAECPIVLQNSAGLVRMNFNINFAYPTRHVRLSGAGQAGLQYGIRIGADSGFSSRFGVQFVGQGSFTMHHVEIAHANMGVQIKIDPTCQPYTWLENTTIENIVLHDNYIHDTANEGMYLGRSAPLRPVLTCGGVTKEYLPPIIRGLQVYNNRLEKTGADGIQASNAQQAEIRNNTVINTGDLVGNGHNHGIILGGNSTGVIRNNYVEDAGGASIAAFGAGDLTIDCNALRLAVNEMILVSERPADNLSGLPALKASITNNALDAPQSRPIAVYGNTLRAGLIENNRIINQPSSQTQFAPVVDASGGVVQNNSPQAVPNCVLPVRP